MKSKNGKTASERTRTKTSKLKDLPGFPKLSPKQIVLETLQNIPDDSDWDQIEDTIRLRRKVEDALDDIRAGNEYDHEEVFKEFEE